MSKHLSKEELQTDPLIENVQKATAFLMKTEPLY